MRWRRAVGAWEAFFDRVQRALLAVHVQHVLRGAHLLVPGRPVEAGDRVFGAVGECLTYVGHV